MNIDKAIKIKQINFDKPFFPDKVVNESRDIVARKGGEYDENGIVLFKNRDGKLYYNPLLIARYALRLLIAWRGTNEDIFKNALFNYDVALSQNPEILNEYGGMYYYPYLFEFRLHNQPDWTMKAPWYSALAQGRILSLFCEMHKSGLVDLAQCDKVFKTLDPDQDGRVTKIDNNGYFWLDEYPHPHIFDMTLNGHISALGGLYDYWRVTKKKRALELLKAGISTVKHYLPYYRNPGHASYYCLAHKMSTHKDNAKYHRIHIQQLDWLYKITGDSFFDEWAYILMEDHPVKVPGIEEIIADSADLNETAKGAKDAKNAEDAEDAEK